jgi:hypothetical protein
MRILSLSFSLLLAAFLSVSEETKVVKCNASEGWTCSVWDQDSQCQGCSKISYKTQEKIQIDPKSPSR